MKKRMRIVPFRHPHDSDLLFWQLQVDNGHGKRSARIGIYRSCAAAMDRAVTGKRLGESRGWSTPALLKQGKPSYPEH
jgi:hypothetical protein